jgi:hypothetical protein
MQSEFEIGSASAHFAEMLLLIYPRKLEMPNPRRMAAVALLEGQRLTPVGGKAQQDSAIHFQFARPYGKLGRLAEAQAETATDERIQSEQHFPAPGEAPPTLQAIPATL